MRNSGTTVAGTGTQEGVLGTCKHGGKATVVATDFTVKGILSTVSGKGSINLPFGFDLPSNVSCHFSSGAAPLTYVSGGSSIALREADLTATPAACGPGLVSGDFAISVASGGRAAIWH